MVRFKNRWLLVEFIPMGTGKPGASPLDGKSIWVALRQSVLSNFGDTGWGSVTPSLSVKYFSPTTNLCIIRVARDYHKIAWASLTMLTNVDGFRYLPHLIHLSGTIKHAQLAAIEHNRQVVARYRALAENPPGYQDTYDMYLQTSELEIQALQD